MIETIQKLINALREELQQYGEMLALLDRQQELVVARNAGEVFQSVSLIQSQAMVIQEARKRREECRQHLAEDSRQEGGAPFAVLIPLMPEDYRPLVRALVDENNSLLARIHHRARQNHLLLARSLELMQGFLNTLFPARETLVYNDHGNREGRRAPARALYEAVC